MPVADENKRRAFARHFALHGNATAAAKAAGVPTSSAHSVGYKWLRHAAVVSLIREELDALMRELSPIAISVLRRIMEDEKVSSATRLAAARDVMDRLGWVPPKRSELKVELRNKPLTEMTREELERIAAGEELEAVFPPV